MAAPGAFFATAALFAPLLVAIGDERAGAAVDGEITGTVALAGNDGIWRVNGDTPKTFVAEADRVDWVAVVHEGPTVALVDSATVRPVQTLDTTRRFFEVTVDTGLGGRAVDADVVDAVIDRATVALAAEMVGTARRLFDMTLQYAKERIQFDVPIGSFQAIQHKLADMALDLERAASAVHYAAMTIDAKDADRTRAVHVAKGAAGTAAKRCAKDGIQIHGGIGYTYEHDLHLFIRRGVRIRVVVRYQRLAPRPPGRPAVLTLRGTQEGVARRARPRRPARSAPRRPTPRARRAPPARPRE